MESETIDAVASNLLSAAAVASTRGVEPHIIYALFAAGHTSLLLCTSHSHTFEKKTPFLFLYSTPEFYKLEN